jgi:type IV secretion system protein VirB4
MLNLSEYRRTSARLADYLPWAALIAPGIVLNKDGSFQCSFGLRGPDLESATEAELIAICARINNALKRFGSGWALFFEAERRPALHYPDSQFPDPISRLVEAERRAAFEREGAHFENAYTLTLLYLPPSDHASKGERLLLESAEEVASYREHLQAFITEADQAFDLLHGALPELYALNDPETLTYLHNSISTKRHRIIVPETPLYLDALLPDEALTGGLEPMLGDHHLRTVTVLGFPNSTQPGMLDDLNRLGFAYRWMTRFIPLDKTDATRELKKLRRQWFAKRKGIVAILREVLYNEPTPLLDTDADNKALDADEALQELGGDHVSYGYVTQTITVWDEDRRAVAEKVRAVERVIQSQGFATIHETVNAVEAWLGSLPGHVYANVRQPLVHTLNLAHLLPLSAVWAGPECNAHLDAPPLLYAETEGTTPFRLSTHVGDVGHMLVVGPTGAGKSVLLALMALQFRRYQGAQVYVFDKGLSARAAILAMGGTHHALGIGGALAFQPLADIDRMEDRAWAAEWIGGLLAHEKVQVTPELKSLVWSALINLASAPRQERTLTGLSLLLQSNALKAALAPYTLEGAFGALLDAAQDGLALSDIQCFEMEELMQTQGIILPVLTYLFHRLESRFDGRPTLLILDEAWLFLDNPLFASRIREWLKTLRKRNVSVIFATQSLADIANSSIASALIESCPQRIFLPNARALEPQAQEIYRRFGLNERQIELIATANSKRDYYLQSRLGNRLFQLGLGPLALALCGTSNAPDQNQIAQILAEKRAQGFAAEWLRFKGLDWAAALLAKHTGESS